MGLPYASIRSIVRRVDQNLKFFYVASVGVKWFLIFFFFGKRRSIYLYTPPEKLLSGLFYTLVDFMMRRVDRT